MSDLQGFVGSGTPIEVSAVVRKAGLRGWLFEHTPAEQRALVPYHYRGRTIQCPEIDLTDGFHSYLGSRGKSVTRSTGQQLRALERKIGKVSFEWGSSATEHFRQLIDWKSDQYRRTGAL